jgi:hypothetical protein
LAGGLGGDPSESNLIKVKGFILAGGYWGDPSESNLIKVNGVILAGGFGGDPSESNRIKAIRPIFRGVLTPGARWARADAVADLCEVGARGWE